MKISKSSLPLIRFSRCRIKGIKEIAVSISSSMALFRRYIQYFPFSSVPGGIRSLNVQYAYLINANRGATCRDSEKHLEVIGINTLQASPL